MGQVSDRAKDETDPGKPRLPAGSQRSGQIPHTPASRAGGRLPYLNIRTRFTLSVLTGLLWVGLSTWLALPWIADLGHAITVPLAIGVTIGEDIALTWAILAADKAIAFEPTAVAMTGPLTLAVLPINLTLSFIMFRMQRGVFEEMGLRVRRNPVGFVMYTLLFQPVMSPVAVYGYSQNIFRRARKW